MRNTLICTVGTSLLYPNLSGLPTNENLYESWLKKQPEEDRKHLPLEFVLKLRDAFTANNIETLAKLLGKLPGTIRLCGAEINSVTDLADRDYCSRDCQLFFCYSQTPDGKKIADILRLFYKVKGYKVILKEILDLQDENPKLFRTKGLRNLAKVISGIIREQTSSFCAINATGGYKAQIAIAVLMGQALGVPVYYKHERFSEIIAFPPMPISLDFNLWLEKNGLLTALDREGVIEWNHELDDEWSEQMETLVEREDNLISLSPTGQIFHETFKGRFESDRDAVLPPSVLNQQKIEPALTSHGWGNARSEILNFLQEITDKCAYVRQCRTHYWNPDLSSPNRFRLKVGQVEGIFSNSSWTVKFYIDTSATTDGQRAACIADLNRRIEDFQ